MQSNCRALAASESNTICLNRRRQHTIPNARSNNQSQRCATTKTTATISKMLHSTSSLRVFLVLAALLIVAHLSSSSGGGLVEGKPLNQYQVKFRRLPPREFAATLGSSITVECEASASPPPTIHWLKNGKRVLQADSDENQVDDLAVNGALSIQIDDVTRISLSASRSRLHIDCADFSDEATYTCVAENAYSRVSSNTKLNLIRPPRAAVQVAANENDLALTEEVAALSELAAEAGALKSLDGPAGPQSPSKSSEAPAASNSNNSGQLSAMPQCLSERLRLGGSASSSATPARIHMWTHNIVEIMKNNVVLYCRSNIKRLQLQSQQQQDLAASTPARQTQQDENSSQQSTPVQQRRPSVSWTLPDDKPVSEDLKDKFEILETGDLLIKDLSWSDMGSYVCTVADEQSSDSVSAFVYPAAVKTTKKRATGGPGRLLRFR